MGSINKRFKPVAVGLVVTLGALALSACGSDPGAPAVTVIPPATSAPAAATTAPADSTVTSEPAVMEATAAPEPTAAPAPAATAVPAPQATTAPAPAATVAPAPEPTEAPALDTVFSEYGFTLGLDLGADVRTTGWTEPEPSETQGLASFVYGGVNVNLVWGPSESRTPLGFLTSAYNVLRAAQPNITFESISEGEITVSGQAGVFGGFKAVDAGGATIGGGLIGTWLCGGGTAFRMTLTGADATVVQFRFDRLLENFACPS